ncbi:ergothioneine biosynthesis glutamate--cysteine ligase EgtA [Yinghuangia seranimata]|uniref:ergothioneine biosynthesis glutamate--cysteine ligase EgtA n=1 Tax=Yinghuangia seranimata TaxID=408067 RepID=UPI00248D0E97|nr:ergothioneine biosynthesis glutamate--cysteine ligase EgtA [Yinghuangia seranimata]MDI2125876.1 ergothioneine biosynthesis glutamate--cysteine ligase EgtA [Yinghuangia seranimata]
MSHISAAPQSGSDTPGDISAGGAPGLAPVPGSEPLTEQQAELHAAATGFHTGPPGRVGVEIEWLVCDEADPAWPVTGERVNAALGTGPLPAGGRVTLEPGGQLELSSAAHPSLARCIEAARQDAALMHDTAAEAGLVLTGAGVDAYRLPRRSLQLPRYVAMERYFDRNGHWGRVMMCSTASVQVCLDPGDDTDDTAGLRHRWALAHRIGPVLLAMFANSPHHGGRSTGWASTRQLAWSRLDAFRTRPPAHDAGTDPREAWARYVMDAPVMCVRRDEPAEWLVPEGMTFRDWTRGALTPAPTVADFDLHVSTLFPPVRAHGTHMELRMIDAQPDGTWTVPLALATALLDDPAASAAAWEHTEQLARSVAAAPSYAWWLRAARFGLNEPLLRTTARALTAAALDALPGMGVPADVFADSVEFAYRYTDRGRCPGDDLLPGAAHEGTRHAAPAR